MIHWRLKKWVHEEISSGNVAVGQELPLSTRINKIRKHPDENIDSFNRIHLSTSHVCLSFYLDLSLVMCNIVLNQSIVSSPVTVYRKVRPRANASELATFYQLAYSGLQSVLLQWAQDRHRCFCWKGDVLRYFAKFPLDIWDPQSMTFCFFTGGLVIIEGESFVKICKILWGTNIHNGCKGEEKLT